MSINEQLFNVAIKGVYDRIEKVTASNDKVKFQLELLVQAQRDQTQILANILAELRSQKPPPSL